MDELTDLESRFYAQGHADGKSHGGLHGAAEGRALGLSSAWDMWEELGFYRGQAQLWSATRDVSGHERAADSVRSLVELIDRVPTANSSTQADVDLPAMLAGVRSRYRVCCSQLGVKPRLKPATASSA